MIVVEESERFWSKDDWEKVLKRYYQPLIDQEAISNFEFTILEGNDTYCVVRRSFYDWRARSLNADQSDDIGRRPKQLPPHIRINAEVTCNGGTAEEALELIQDYRDYWPEGLELNSYAMGQAKGEESYTILSFANYEEELEEPSEDDEEEEEDGDINYK